MMKDPLCREAHARLCQVLYIVSPSTSSYLLSFRFPLLALCPRGLRGRFFICVRRSGTGAVLIGSLFVHRFLEIHRFLTFHNVKVHMFRTKNGAQRKKNQKKYGTVENTRQLSDSTYPEVPVEGSRRIEK